MVLHISVSMDKTLPPRRNPRALLLVFVLAVCTVAVHMALRAATHFFPTSLSHLTVKDPVGDPTRHPDIHPDTRHVARGRHGMVSCDVPLCSEMGRDILAKGGNAADAAITTALCIGSINLHSLGIGGGGFILSFVNNRSISIDAREMAPAKAYRDMYKGRELQARFGGLAVGVPGELAGLFELFRNSGLGNLTWHELFEPVVQLNRRGWRASEVWTRAASMMDELVLTRVPLLKSLWDFIYRENGEVVKAGDLVRRHNLARLLELIAKNGLDAIFYDPQGPFAPRLAAAVQAAGGLLTASDFAHYTTKVEPAIEFDFSGKTLVTTAGVSLGLALVAGLNFYNHMYNQSDVECGVLLTHRLIEAFKWAASARSHLGTVNLTRFDHLKKLFLSKAWVEKLETLHSESQTFSWQHYHPQYAIDQRHGTAHFLVVDTWGNAVSMTTTVNLLFGSLVYEPTTGVVLNDQMDDFSQPGLPNAFNLTPSVFNFVAPRARPLLLSCPAIVKTGDDVELVIGAAGGSRIVTAVLQAIVRTVFYKWPLLHTILFPRLHHQLLPVEVYAENLELWEDECPGVIAQLEAKNHTFYNLGALTAMNGVLRSGDGWEGVADYWRKQGHAAGY